VCVCACERERENRPQNFIEKERLILASVSVCVILYTFIIELPYSRIFKAHTETKKSDLHFLLTFPNQNYR